MDELQKLSRSFNTMTDLCSDCAWSSRRRSGCRTNSRLRRRCRRTLSRTRISLERLQLHGVCRPARTVSGDYDDFSSFKAHDGERRGAAGWGGLGDISGKGISAALFMATLIRR